MQGIYPHGIDGSHINGVACLKSRRLLATGDDYGLVNIYNDPCLEEHVGKSYRGHSEHVVRIKFAQEGKYMISIGGYDQTIIQWKREGEDTDNESESSVDEENLPNNALTEEQKKKLDDFSADDTDSDEGLDERQRLLNQAKLKDKMNAKVDEAKDEEEDDEGDHFSEGEDIDEELDNIQGISMQDSPAKGAKTKEIKPFDVSVDSIKKKKFDPEADEEEEDDFPSND